MNKKQYYEKKLECVLLQESHQVAINILKQTTGIGGKHLTIGTMMLLRARAQLVMAVFNTALLRKFC